MASIEPKHPPIPRKKTRPTPEERQRILDDFEREQDDEKQRILERMLTRKKLQPFGTPV